MSKAVRWNLHNDMSSNVIPGLMFADVVHGTKKSNKVFKLYVPTKKVPIVPIKNDPPKKDGRFTVPTVPAKISHLSRTVDLL